MYRDHQSRADDNQTKTEKQDKNYIVKVCEWVRP